MGSPSSAVQVSHRARPAPDIRAWTRPGSVPAAPSRARARPAPRAAKGTTERAPPTMSAIAGASQCRDRPARLVRLSGPEADEVRLRIEGIRRARHRLDREPDPGALRIGKVRRVDLQPRAGRVEGHRYA